MLKVTNGRKWVVAVFAPGFPPASLGGGPIRTLEALVESASADFDVRVITPDRDHGATARLAVAGNRWLDHGAARVYFASTNRVRLLAKALLAVRAQRPMVLYLNSFFHPTLSVLPQLLMTLGFWGRPIRLLAPRGEFGTGALLRSTTKKRLYIFFYKALSLHRRVYWHASSAAEAGDIVREWGNSARILVREDETSLPRHARAAPRNDLNNVLQVNFVFLGRLVEHKGLLILLDALQNVNSAVNLDIYGPEEDALYLVACRESANRLPAHVTARFMGPVKPDEVRDRLCSYDALLLPTAGENFGHVIAEALSVSCPVVCTPYTPWTSVLTDGGGSLVSDQSPERWRTAIAGYAAQSLEERSAGRAAAGAAYDRWMSQLKGPHIFEMLRFADESK
ncbi:glycosyltransferase family 4 protein [Cryobacterium sp. TMT4-10]|uniref:glycosyltransferase family 4 protein n=1 Tax=Cryobacterium sp. TMT4-10 TaxID=1259256 RepID=UPI00106B7776|nr:glycosyltransferase family 4 protein [Cryobacterium sp. TMT4-10]TFD16304.1 glycosyltransferase [Cryobacterium sp. TMT4-10]